MVHSRRLLSVFGIACLALFSTTTEAQETIRLAGSGRFDLKADAQVDALNDAVVLAGNLSADRMNWLPTSQQAAGYTVTGPISHRSWRIWKLQFVPKGTGKVTLALMGPWESVGNGKLARLDVQWDAITAEGATIRNGSFETPGKPAAEWTGSGIVKTDGNERFAQTWHNAPLFQDLQVTASVPVTLTLSVRAAVPPDYQEMARIASTDTPAHWAATKFKRGANFGNWLEAPRNQDWGASYSPTDVELVKREGFDHIRLPIAWHNYATGPNYAIEPAIFAKADTIIDAALQHDLAIMINIHHFDQFTSNPEAQRGKFLRIWQQVATHYAKHNSLLAFELINEPKDAATTEVLNPIYAEVIAEIRKTNPNRTIFVGPGRWNSVTELPNLRLPATDTNLIVTLHNYDPFMFTHQGASWTGGATPVTGIQFPGPPATPHPAANDNSVPTSVREWLTRYNTLPAAQNPCTADGFEALIRDAAEWSAYYGRPVHFGEFGAYTRADNESRARYYQAFRTAAEEMQIGWAIWDWSAGFRYWNKSTNQPMPGMRQALFGKS